MIGLKQTETFRKWLAKLRSERAVTAIISRLDRLAFGHAGDAEPVGKGVSELRIHYGPGYRVYFQRRGNTIIVLCVFRRSVTDRFGIVTAEFGSVTDHFGDVTDGHLVPA